MLGLLCVQLGPGPKGEELFHSLQPLLISVLSDSTASPTARLHVSIATPVPKQCVGFHLSSDSLIMTFLMLTHGGLALSSFLQCASALGLGCYVAATDIQVGGLWTHVVAQLGSAALSVSHACLPVLLGPGLLLGLLGRCFQLVLWHEWLCCFSGSCQPTWPALCCPAGLGIAAHHLS